MKVRRLRAHKRGRIEIIPMIDVIFFLLATFMLASLAMQNLRSLAVNLPQGQAAAMSAKKPVTLTVTRDNQILINETPVTLANLASTLKPMLQTPDADIIVAADHAATQGVVVQAMLAARTAGAQHFLIAVKHAQ
ncbi:MAG: biopolymer transporter ExbD [Burkholderiales bacterium]|nr:biopolymer transporter ExbD [Burkholderiales bacterium]